MVDVTQEVQAIGPGFRRRADSIHMGFWTPELARWTDLDDFIQKESFSEQPFTKP